MKLSWAMLMTAASLDTVIGARFRGTRSGGTGVAELHADAADRVEPSVQDLVHTMERAVGAVLQQSVSNSSKSASTLISLRKAKEVLNTMVEKAQVEFDNKVAVDEGLEATDRAAEVQVAADLERLEKRVAGQMTTIVEKELAATNVSAQAQLIADSKRLKQQVADLLNPSGDDTSAIADVTMLVDGVPGVHGDADDRRATPLQDMVHNMRRAVAVVFEKSSSSSSEAAATLNSLREAGAFLTRVVGKAQVELDKEILEAKDIEVRNRRAEAQVVTHIERLEQHATDQTTAGMADMQSQGRLSGDENDNSSFANLAQAYLQ